MKNLRKTFLFVVFTFVMFAIFTCVSFVSADTVKTDDGKYNYTTTSETVRELATGATVVVNEGYTTRSKVDYYQRVTMYTCDVAANSDIKLATWAIPLEDGTGFIRRDLLTIAKDYEKHNPGWVILGGVNADQYFATLGTGVATNGSFLYVPQPYYPLITNGDVLFGVSALGYATFSSVVGLKNDGSEKPFVNGTRGTKGFYIHVYNSMMQEIASYPIDGINKALGENGTVVIASYRNSTTTFANAKSSGVGSVYVVSNPDMSYVSNSRTWTNVTEYATDAFFGKGSISEVTNDVTFTEEKGFAIETTNEELKAKLGVGTYIKVQFEFDDAFNGIQEATGYHTVQRANGKDKNVDNSYNTRAYPRSWFGFDAKGVAYLMTCWGDNSAPTTGLYAQEMNAYCKKYGINDAWQMDGGGSVTSVVRKEDGTLDYAEACVEQSHKEGELAYTEYRYILSGLFVVMKAPNPVTEITENANGEVTFNINSFGLASKYDALKLRVANVNTGVYQEADIDLTKNSNVINFKDLVTNEEFTYEYISTKNGVEQRGFAQKVFASNKADPIIKSVNAKKNANGYDITVVYTDKDNAVDKMYVTYGGTEYTCTVDKENNLATVSVTGVSSLWDVKVAYSGVLNSRSIKETKVDLTYKGFSFPVSYCFEKVMSDFEDMLKEFCR